MGHPEFVARTEKQGTGGPRQFSKAIPQSCAGKDWHLSYFCLRHVRLGKDIHATGLPRRNATIHPRIPEEVLAVEGVFQSGMDIQHLLVDAEAAVHVDIETIVCRTALGVDSGKVVDAARLFFREGHIERRVRTSTGIGVPQRQLDVRREPNSYQPIGDERKVEVTRTHHSVGGSVSCARIT